MEAAIIISSIIFIIIFIVLVLSNKTQMAEYEYEDDDDDEKIIFTKEEAEEKARLTLDNEEAAIKEKRKFLVYSVICQRYKKAEPFMMEELCKRIILTIRNDIHVNEFSLPYFLPAILQQLVNENKIGSFKRNNCIFYFRY